MAMELEPSAKATCPRPQPGILIFWFIRYFGILMFSVFVIRVLGIRVLGIGYRVIGIFILSNTLDARMGRRIEAFFILYTTFEAFYIKSCQSNTFLQYLLGKSVNILK